MIISDLMMNIKNTFLKLKCDGRGIFFECVRFLGAGIANTLLTLLLFQVFLFLMSYQVSYLLSWLIGLVFVTIFYPIFVFKTTFPTPIRIIQNTLWYFVYFMSSYYLLKLFTEKFSFSPRIAVFGVLIIMVPISFIFTRKIFKGQGFLRLNTQKNGVP